MHNPTVNFARALRVFPEKSPMIPRLITPHLLRLAQGVVQDLNS
jgi:hypothetical protein